MSLFKKFVTLSIITAGTAFIAKVFKAKNDDLNNNLVSEEATPGVNQKSNTNNTVPSSTDTPEIRVQKMFKDLGMTEEQKEKYKASIEEVLNTKNSKGEPVSFNADTQLIEEDKALSAVLDEVQYGMYRDWASKNPNSN